MSDIVAELRERALQAEQDGEPIALLDDAAGEIERLRSWVRIQDAVIHSGNVATLTDAEREEVRRAREELLSCLRGYDNPFANEKRRRAAVLAGILERLG